MNKIKLHKVIWNEFERLHIITTAGNIMSLTEAVLEFEASQQSVQADKCPVCAGKGVFGLNYQVEGNISFSFISIILFS